MHSKPQLQCAHVTRVVEEVNLGRVFTLGIFVEFTVVTFAFWGNEKTT